MRLIALDLNHNKLKELPPDVMSMRGLYYTRKKKKLNTQVYISFAALKKLDVSNNCLEIIHPLGELGKIEKLDFRMNNLSAFPDVRGCTSLQELHLAHNGITEIDVNYLESLGQLRVLNMSNNEVDVIPDEIILLINCEQLDLSYNNISA